ncbi:MAG: hypothetical protein ACRCVV_10180 [Shewanella sp.]
MNTINAETLKAAVNTSSILGQMDMEQNSFAQMVEVSKNEAMLGENTNIAAAMLGVGLAVGLELISTNGNKLSASVAAVTGCSLVYAAKDALRGYQSTGTAVASTLIAYKLSAMPARAVASYFPAVNTVERVIEVPVQVNAE